MIMFIMDVTQLAIDLGSTKMENNYS